MPELRTLDLVKIFRLVKYPVEKLEPTLPHNIKVCRLYKRALKLSLPAPWFSHIFLPYVFVAQSHFGADIALKSRLNDKHTQKATFSTLERDDSPLEGVYTWSLQSIID